jgi:hypothetical protein
VVRLHAEAWTITTIAAYLQTSRARISEVLKRWIAEGVRGLDDKSHAPKNPARKVNLKAMAAIRRLQANPALGEFRVHAALAQLGIHLSPRTCGRILALNRTLYGLPRPSSAEPYEKKPMPFGAQRRHQYWSVVSCSIERGRSAPSSKSWRTSPGHPCKRRPTRTRAPP